MLILCDSERLFGGLLSNYVYLMVDCHEFITTRGERLGLEAIFNIVPGRSNSIAPLKNLLSTFRKAVPLVAKNPAINVSKVEYSDFVREGIVNMDMLV